MEPRIATPGGKGPGSPSGAAAPAVAVEGIHKSYGVVKALQPATLELARGEVHALVGENGSGKSTFVGIISGAVKLDGGTVHIDGAPAKRHTPAESQALGALTVFQDGSLFGELTVAQNLYLGTPPARRPGFREAEDWAAEMLPKYGLDHVSPGARAEDLSPGDRQLLEIVRALMAEPTVLMLDEATSALDAAGVDRALTLTRAAADLGTAVLFVTHRLAEVFRVADRISVLRDGMWQGTHEVGDIDAHRLVELMAGTSVDVEFPPRAQPDKIGAVALSAADLAAEGFGPIDVELRRGEIVGIAGADDNGQQQLLRGLAGVGSPEGRLEAAGHPVANYSDAFGAGLLFLSGDRRTESLFAPLSVRENVAVGMLGPLSRMGVLSNSRERGLIRDTISRFGIRVGSPEQPVTSLSGGNQQKVALGRVLATGPNVLLIEEPTQGVDVRSRMDIYRKLRESADQGVAVVINSSDASELTGLCDRILVVSRGKIVAELRGGEATEEGVVKAFAGVGHADGTHTDGTSGAPAPSPSDPGDPPAAPAAAEADPPPVLHESQEVTGLRRLARDHQDAVRLLLLVGLLVLIGGYAQSQNDTFLTEPSLFNIFLLTVPLAAVAAAQFVVLYIGGIDISVGATMGMTVAVMSYFVEDSSFVPGLLISLVIALVVGGIVGAVNATLVEGVRISPVIATIATLGIVQGFGFVLRPTAEGAISPEFSETLTKTVGPVPWALIVLAVLFVAGDWALRSTGTGLRLRATGLDPRFAYRLGVNAPRLRALAYVLCAILAALAGVLLAAQVGLGDSSVGSGFTLLAIAAPVLGGASLLGGYGTFVGCLIGSLLLVLTQNLTTILGINNALGFILTGGLTILALLMYTRGAGATLRTSVRTLRHKLTTRTAS